MKPLKETDIQKSIIDYLELKGYLVVKVNNGGIYVKKTGRYIPPKAKGVSDLLFWRCRLRNDGRRTMPTREFPIYGSIEVKRKPNKPTTEQLEWGEQMKHAGGVFIVAYSLDDVMEAMG